MRVRSQLLRIYRLLFKTYGPQSWWPGESSFEVMVGAILTQNTSWKNVEKSVLRLKEKGFLSPEGIRRLEKSELASVIRSSGTFRIKTERLKNFINFLFDEFDGDLVKMKGVPLNKLRDELLRVKGIGPETADSILLYGLGKPIFVIDAYTKRILCRHGMIPEKASYENVQDLFMENLPHNGRLFNEYHALLVHLGKWSCRKVPKCGTCPLKGIGQKARGKG